MKLIGYALSIAGLFFVKPIWLYFAFGALTGLIFFYIDNEFSKKIFGEYATSSVISRINKYEIVFRIGCCRTVFFFVQFKTKEVKR